MAVAYLNDGATSVADANWSDGDGFNNSASDSQLIIADQSQAITGGLNQSGSTNPTDYLWILRGAPRIRGTDGSSLRYKPDASYTTDANFIWATNGGLIAVTFETNACTLGVLNGGGEVNLTGGTITTLVVLRGTVNIGASCTVTNLLLMSGSVVAESGTAFTTVRQSGGRLDSRRRIITAHLTGIGLMLDDNTSGSTMTTMNQYGGTYSPVAGGVATYNLHAGTIALDAAQRELTLGATAFVNYSANRIPSDTVLVTFSNKTDYALISGGTGQA